MATFDSRLLKTLLLRMPMAYEWVQSVRDRKFMRQALAVGSFAQHGEDLQLLRLLEESGSRGPYLDVGCNHPFRLSNTFLLYRRGWRGLCIDPLPRFGPLYRKWRPEDRFHCVAVSEAVGELPLYEFESDVLSTLDATLAREYQAKGYRLKGGSMVVAEPLDRSLERAGLNAPLSLLSLDIEGHELPALKSLDLERWRPTLICMEALTASGQRNVAAIDHLLANSYRVAADLGLNIVFRREAVPTP